MTNSKKIEKPKFEFYGKHGFLTYKTHLDPKLFKKRKWKHKLCWETGETGYEHTHILICYNKKTHIRDSRHWDVNGIHPNFEKVLTQKHWKNIVGYTDKQFDVREDTLTGHEYEWLGSTRTLIQAHNCWNDVINDDSIAESIQKYLNWAKEVWRCRPKPNLTENAKLKPWQTELIKDLEDQDDRKVKWIFDEEGGNGKSFLTNYLLDRGAFFCNNGKIADVAYAYEEEDIVIFDLPRTTIDTEGKDWTPYRLMEMFKDGRLFSAKYQSCVKRFPSCKVVVFANFKPNRKAMSKDRWDVQTLKNEKLGTEVLNIKGTSEPGKERTEKIFWTRSERLDNLRNSDLPELIGSLPDEFSKDSLDYWDEYELD